LKNNFIAANTEAYTALAFPSTIKNFAREMLLDASQCDNSVFMLPPLQRDSASRKGIHYMTEKLIVSHYNNSFPFMNSTKIREQIKIITQYVTGKYFTEDFKRVMADLMLNTQGENRTIEESIVSYTLSQFSLFCQAQALELQSLKGELVGKSSHPYLSMVQDKQK
jgi:hypothetical protein